MVSFKRTDKNPLVSKQKAVVFTGAEMRIGAEKREVCFSHEAKDRQPKNVSSEEANTRVWVMGHSWERQVGMTADQVRGGKA